MRCSTSLPTGNGPFPLYLASSRLRCVRCWTVVNREDPCEDPFDSYIGSSTKVERNLSETGQRSQFSLENATSLLSPGQSSSNPSTVNDSCSCRGLYIQFAVTIRAHLNPRSSRFKCVQVLGTRPGSSHECKGSCSRF